jgi:hypothetical protein
MGVYAGTFGEKRAVDAWRAGSVAMARGEEARAAALRLQRLHEQERRNQLGIGTIPAEVLKNQLDAQLCRDFLHMVSQQDRLDLGTRLPVTRGDQESYIRGFLIGYAGERDYEPADSGWTKGAVSVYLCEDGFLRTYDPSRTRKNPPELALQGVPLLSDGEFAQIYPGHFAEGTVPRRRKAVDASKNLPRGVESVTHPYKEGAGTYQTHQVHPFQQETIENVLAATAYHVIQEGQPRPMYHFDPASTK